MRQEYAMVEIKRHCTADDLWIVFNDKVYNMTSYFKQHPGGSAMLRQAGKDASVAMRMEQAHSLSWSFIEKKLEELYIGDLKD